jgi:uncharacterized membrane protein
MRPQADHLIRTEIVISLVLRYGVILCGLVIALGLLLHEIHASGAPGASSSAFISNLMRGEVLAGAPVPRSWQDFRAGFLSLSPDAIMAAGLLLLILLPVARVGMTVLLFLLERDWPFFFITLSVLTILLSSLLLGKAL